MSHKLTQDAYRKLIEEDLRWLVTNTEHGLEQAHIADVLWDSIFTLYGDDGRTARPHEWSPMFAHKFGGPRHD